MKVIGIIPSRYASSRFPGKPLADIQGKPMVQRVYESVLKCKDIASVYVATDDQRIENAVKDFQGKVIMTSEKHLSGTDRIKEALENCGESCDVVLNIQGDEPFIESEQLSELVSCFNDPGIKIATLARKIESVHELTNHHSVKVVLNTNADALLFSRTAIPYFRGENFSEWLKLHTYWRHVGLYGFKPDTLTELSKLEPSPLELAESLEQLRWLENGYQIRVGITKFISHPVDTPEDLQALLKNSSNKL